MTTVLRRYTNFPALIYLLREKKITLLDPESWDDKNDSYFLSTYKKKKLKTVLALCFAQASETYHHWRVFADGSSGVCIRFKRDELVNAVQKQRGAIAKPVRYLAIEDIEQKDLKIEDLPFLKRAPYKDEREFRVVYESATDSHASLNIALPLRCIERITLSPWVPSVLADQLKSTIKEINGCKKLELVRSTLISNERWKKASDTAI